MQKRFAFFPALMCIFLLAPCFAEAAPQEPKRGPVAKKALAGPLSKVNEIVFTTRAKYKDGHWYANIGYFCEDENEKARAGDGGPDIGKLCKLNIRERTVEVLLDAQGGSVRDPQVHYDGEKILFSHRKADSDYYNLYEIGTDGSGLRQITFGAFDDFEPCYMPDGDIMFVSTRCNRWVNCYLTQVAVLYRCDADGKNIRQISANVEHDNTPWMLPDGRVLYTRWEYVDRSQVQYHHLWTMNPDGTNQTTYFGNMHAGGLFIDAKPIPGTDDVVVSLSPGHGRNEHVGIASIISPKNGPDDQSYIKPLREKFMISDPYPISRDCFLMAQQNKIVVMNGEGRTEVLHVAPKEQWIHEPRPIMPRKREYQVVTRTDSGKKTGQLLLTDVYEGRNMAGVEKGDIKKLLVLESLPKPVNFSGGADLLSWLGTFTLERVLGTVPVEEDGSAFFEVPANRAVFFVGLDEDDLSVKRMQSFTSVMPGETLSCVGCHEHRTRTPKASASALVLAAQRPASRIESFRGFPDVLDFNRDIQPILDKHCIDCHSFDEHAGNISLEGDLGTAYSHSYYALLANLQVADGRNGLGNRPPRSIGTSASALMDKIDGSHEGVEVSPDEWRTIWLWIESGAPYAGTYAGLRTAESRTYAQSGIVFGGQKNLLKRRCAECHDLSDPTNENGMSLPFAPVMKRNPRGLDRPTAIHERVILEDDPIARFSSQILLNLTRPDKSPLLLGPLAKRAGGWGSCGDVFKNKEDPDYKGLLSSIRRCKERVDFEPRFGTPEFKPNRQYVREMKRYGILPASFDLSKDDIDPFATDQAYWKSLWHDSD